MTEETINVAGVEINKERFPKLYEIAKNNPDGLAQQLKTLDRAQRGPNDKENLGMTAALLESDLQHG